MSNDPLLDELTDGFRLAQVEYEETARSTFVEASTGMEHRENYDRAKFLYYSRRVEAWNRYHFALLDEVRA